MQPRHAVQLFGLAAAAGATTVHAAPAIREKFIGVWKLVGYDSPPAEGPVRQIYGANPIGRITYDKAGHMSAVLVRPNLTAPQNVRNATVEELRDEQRGLVAQFGTLGVDGAATTMI